MDKDTRAVMRMFSFALVMIGVVVFGQLYQSTHNKVFLVLNFGIIILNTMYVLWDYHLDNRLIKQAEQLESDMFFSIFKQIYQQNKEKEFEQVIHSSLDTMHTTATWDFLSRDNIRHLQSDKAKTLFYFDKFMHSIKNFLQDNPEITEDVLRQNEK